jgi:hypothetical protein
MQAAKTHDMFQFVCLVLNLCSLHGMKGTALQVERSRDRSPVESLGIFSEATDGGMCPGVDSASKNEYQENSWG